MEEGKKITYNDLVYVLNEKEKTASVVDFRKNVSSIIVPRFIYSNSNIYTVTSLADRSFIYSSAESIRISNPSEIRSIGNDSFFESSIEFIELPSHISEFKEDWNNNFFSIKNIKVIESSEKNIKIIDNKFLVGKSDTKSDTFDILLLAFGEIEEAIIPSYIKHISSKAFLSCEKLKVIKIEENSELQSIGKYAFSCPCIECIEHPSNVVDLKKFWCSQIPNNIEFKIIKKGEENIKIVDEKFLVGKSDRKSDIFDVLYYVPRTIEEITIPSYIKRIEAYAFCNCKKLKTVNFLDDSELESIGEFAFIDSGIENFIVPSHVKEICDNAFCSCQNIQSIKFKENSELQTIGSEVLYNSTINYIEIPSSVREFKDDWCLETSYLNELKVIKNGEENIKIIDNNLLVGKSDLKSDVFDIVLFAPRNIIEATIPANIKQIGSSALDKCEKLTSIYFDSCSMLQKICRNAFNESSIQKIHVPSSVIEIGPYSLASYNLNHINFGENSELKILGQSSFFFTSFEEICIPSNVIEIPENLVELNKKIRKIKFDKNSQLRSICQNAFSMSYIESIEIPSSVVEFKEGWCNDLVHLKEIKVIQNGAENIKFIDESKFLVGKTDLKSDNFDVIYFALSVIKKVFIPKCIKIIATHSFSNCNNLRFVSFPENSELRSIDTCAFRCTEISSISLPPNVTELGYNAFFRCNELKIVELTSRMSFESVHQSLLFCIKSDVTIMVSYI